MYCMSVILNIKEPLETVDLDSELTEYRCEKGETLFYYNRLTKDHKWPIYNQNVRILVCVMELKQAYLL